MSTSPSLPRLLVANRFAGREDCTWHAHEGHEIVLVRSGTCSIACGDVELACSAGTLAVLPRGVPQYQRNRGRVCTSYVVWQAGSALLDPAARTLRLPLESRPARWIEDVCDLAHDPDVPPSSADGLLLALLGAIARLDDDRRRDAVHPALAEATRRLTSDLVRPLDLDRLAREVGLSASHLARLFRLHHGCPPLRYQHRLRLRLAERLLDDPLLSVAEVGRRCGFPDLNYFCRVFRRHAGSPPGTWRGSRRDGRERTNAVAKPSAFCSAGREPHEKARAQRP
jgi:AraC-like DNA-binding protein